MSDLKRLDEALRSYDRALALKPDYVEALTNRGVVLADLKRSDEALQSYDRALALKPDDVEALYNRGTTLNGLQRHDEALEYYDRALALKPEHAQAHWNRALCSLQLGDFASGWAEYEWRWRRNRPENAKREFRQPLWLGIEPLAGKTILLHAEQGLGDTLQFCRYVRPVAALGARVVLEVQPPLLPLLRRLEGASELRATGAALPAFDYHCPLLSLPLAFKTELASVPSDIPYLRSDAARVEKWRERLGPKMQPRVGIAWSGATGHKNDHNRSLSLAQVLPLLIEQVQWVSLQKELREADAQLMSAQTPMRSYGEELKDFADTAALVELMDVVVAVDTSVAHLAGALGKPVWILLPFNSDWRWLLDRDDSLWYPTARLFRQPAIGDWASVIDTVRNELARELGALRE